VLDNVPRLRDAPVPPLAIVEQALLHVGLDDPADLELNENILKVQLKRNATSKESCLFHLASSAIFYTDILE
jgi:hypothetical protein